MRLKFLYAAVILSAVTIFTACGLIENKSNSQAQNANNTPNVTSTPYPDGARRVTIDELERMMKDGRAFVVDVRNQDSFDAGHIPGAKLIPSGDILNHLKELPRNKLIVTYCSWHAEHTSAGAVVALKSKGIENAAALLGGFNLWQQQGKPIEKKR
jgi:rhodanese-related sulfurtransferase